ncbi:hypothetical protein K504DRAFT_500684 [Pleomassaria siparia CBS 279.74]|uniref:Uncharacterized protein n=1 Tax=Pleomassaria siparia CBS 279.74 TaxID=1314801 RepID=A0A6G1KE75_9PLEO|nr:hypothetical protein K504DRAFT_500684 [Pleomassaria siparia CBS 279.74]
MNQQFCNHRVIPRNTNLTFSDSDVLLQIHIRNDALASLILLNLSLILQVNVPLPVLERHFDNVPVMVYIHGGGFVLGKIDEQHNTAHMVEQSLLDS